MTEDLSTQEKLADQYAAQGKSQHAVRLLFDLIVKYAKAKNFQKAEALREKLYDIDAMALTEIIKSGEIIEAEKSVAMDQNHLDIWAELYKSLTKEEANALYFALKQSEHGSDEIIFQQGDRNDKLFFVNFGQLKLIYSQAGRENLIRLIEPGMIAGEDTFFSITFCTTSLITNSRVKLSYLEKEDFQQWQENFVSLSSKLEDHCTRLRKSYDMMMRKGINRRVHNRISVSGTVMFQVLSSSGSTIGKPFKGELSDISIGGASFFIKTSSHKNALMLLGRTLRIKSAFAVKGYPVSIDETGTIIGVINHLFSDYSVHLKFDKTLKNKVVEKLSSLAA